MILPFSPKYALLGGLSVAGTPALAYGGWYIYDESNPTGHKSMSRKDYSWSPLPHRLKDPKVSETKRTHPSDLPLSLSSGDCFHRFFPGAEIRFDPMVITGTQESYSVPNPASSATKPNPIGCSTMSLFVGEDKTKFAFVSETTVKNDRAGMAVWAAAKNAMFGDVASSGGQSSIPIQLHYVAAFLERGQKGWSVKGGIQWSDVTAPYVGSELKIISPDGTLNGQYKFSNDTTPVANTTHHYYSGIWEQSRGDEGEEIFKEICVAFMPWKVSSGSPQGDDVSGCKKVDPEILGGSGNFTHFDATIGLGTKGYKKVDSVYFTEGNQWKYTGGGSSIDFSSTLDTWYAPFKNKKGKWRTDVEDYCGGLAGIRRADDNTLYLLEGFCYIRNASAL